MSRDIYITTIIDQGHRMTLGINERQYSILDAVYQLQQKTGWCYASNRTLGKMLGGINVSNLTKIVAQLKEKGLLEKGRNGRDLRTTKAYDKDLNVRQMNPYRW